MNGRRSRAPSHHRPSASYRRTVIDESPPGPPDDRPWLEPDRRPADVDDDTVTAVGRLTEALEWIERARGRLYDFHQLSGHADLLVGDAADELEAAGHADLAQRVRDELVGRNVIEGRWTFQIVEEYDATYWQPARSLVDEVEQQLVGGRHHVHESEMKERRRSHGRRHHESRPDAGS
jgi:hypothetical protein